MIQSMYAETGLNTGLQKNRITMGFHSSKFTSAKGAPVALMSELYTGLGVRKLGYG